MDKIKDDITIEDQTNLVPNKVIAEIHTKILNFRLKFNLTSHKLCYYQHKYETISD